MCFFQTTRITKYFAGTISRTHNYKDWIEGLTIIKKFVFTYNSSYLRQTKKCRFMSRTYYVLATWLWWQLDKFQFVVGNINNLWKNVVDSLYILINKNLIIRVYILISVWLCIYERQDISDSLNDETKYCVCIDNSIFSQ